MKMGKSTRWKVWLTILDFKVCMECKTKHGKIRSRKEALLDMPPLHEYCRCTQPDVETKTAGKATDNSINGADYWLYYFKKLPEYYVSFSEARALGWNPEEGNLAEICPGMMIARGRFRNSKGLLPAAPDRIWYEADINYQNGYRGKERILYSNDGLLFVTYDHYETFYEIVGGIQ